MKPGELLIEMLEGFWQRKPSSSFTIIETGCIRDAHAYEDLPIGHGQEGAGWSTLYFAKWAQGQVLYSDEGVIKYAAQIHSCDINQRHIDTAKEVLGDLVPLVEFHCCDSVDFISRFQGKIDFAYLDSSDDLEHAFREFLACEANHVPFVVMDDFRSKCLMAYAYALGKGYTVYQKHRFTVIELH